ncbi:methionyl-tRNA formyltransferase [Ophiocordyceps camponoti-floridani]|uniref:methionyl-tRNA formyltransferase n=1 Tax=Ophiocordyceps camponoti-floridani TaxID=2030778 RepID=A0A8H4VC10_9HYPO|nr:methionyl-tRNA formyltransferase [Ophiocordyceps camponoti-floridani]
MLLSRARPVAFKHRPSPRRWFRTASDPLRILFCGSDDFSCESLRALHGELGHGRLVEALDVMVLPARRAGRGREHLREVPCKALADMLQLPLHQRETFTGWKVPAGTNLIVVVSFGLFVPPRILRSTKYGGVNVHPSFLPDLRGPAPLHHAILRGDRHIGISLQTLDERRFDHGVVLAQTPAPGLSVPPGASIQTVTAMAATEGAQMLVRGLRHGLHLSPHRDAGWKGAELEGRTPMHAPKVTKADSQIDWATWTTMDDFYRRLRVFSSVWTRVVFSGGQIRRLILQQVEAVPGDEDPVGVEGTICFEQQDGQDGTTTWERAVRVDRKSGDCAVRLGSGGVWLRFRSAKVEGKDWQDAATVLGPSLSRGVGGNKRLTTGVGSGVSAR